MGARGNTVAPKQTYDLNIAGITRLITPNELKEEMPISDRASEVVSESRQVIQNILEGEDPRLLVIVGPCSIHDPKAALEYAAKLRELHDAFQDHLYIVMRAYFEKPRTTIGWKGLINDPTLDGRCDMAAGLREARKLLLQITELGLPVATEVLDPVIPQYLAGLVSWAAVGARTTESQTHREMVSGLSMPVGFKNGTEGNLQIAVDGILSARHPHHFLGIDQDGRTAIVETKGNRFGHVILRGGRGGPNYDAVSVAETAETLVAAKLPPRIMIDCSHANSRKRFEMQPEVCRDVLRQRCDGNTNIIGIMLESNLHEGNQPLPLDLSELQYGVSVTDGCIDWPCTEALLQEACEQLQSEQTVTV
jgi:3-deoxy-7-phosphoheptulonate synthase